MVQRNQSLVVASMLVERKNSVNNLLAAMLYTEVVDRLGAREKTMV